MPEWPALDVIGRDLLVVPAWRRTLTLAMPFLLAALFFVFAARGLWLGSLLCAMAMTFLTYGSISHDLVHRNLHLPRWLNEALLFAIELITFRCGHAYRIVHLHHHAHFPATDDLEGSAAAMSWWRALLEGPILQPRLLWFALRSGRDRAWIIAEAITVMLLLTICIALIPITIVPAAYAALMIAGSWTFPITPHTSRMSRTASRTSPRRSCFAAGFSRSSAASICTTSNITSIRRYRITTGRSSHAGSIRSSSEPGSFR